MLRWAAILGALVFVIMLLVLWFDEPCVVNMSPTKKLSCDEWHERAKSGTLNR